MSRVGHECLDQRARRTAVFVTAIALLLAALLPVGTPLDDVASGKAKGGDGSTRKAESKRHSVVWAVGDGADGGAHGLAVAEMIASHRVDRFLYLGDVYNQGTALEFETNYRPLFGRFDAIAAPTIGNHEWPNVATGYVPYWTAVWGTPPAFWYEFAASGWHLISLNSNQPIDEGSAQLAWLRETLAASSRYGNCRIAFMHHPIFSAGPHGDTSSLQPLFAEIEGDASIVLSGHDHDMQRFHPIGGITQLLSGAGGARLYGVNRADPRLAFADDAHYGALRLKLRPGRAVLSFVAADGARLDRSAVRCRKRTAS